MIRPLPKGLEIAQDCGLRIKTVFRPTWDSAIACYRMNPGRGQAKPICTPGRRHLVISGKGSRAVDHGGYICQFDFSQILRVSFLWAVGGRWQSQKIPFPIFICMLGRDIPRLRVPPDQSAGWDPLRRVSGDIAVHRLIKKG